MAAESDGEGGAAGMLGGIIGKGVKPDGEEVLRLGG